MPMPSCEECKGACCESFALPLMLANVPPDPRRWIELHATSIDQSGLWFEARCTKLTPEGRCGIYDTRPDVCRRFEVGSPDCLETRRRRGRE